VKKKYKIKMGSLIFAFTLLTNGSCGTDSLVDCAHKTQFSQNCSEQTRDEQAVLALNAGDLTTAQSLLEGLIAQYPDEYFRYPRLAVVYAEQGGFDLLSVTQLQTSAAKDITELIGEFLPSPAKLTKNEYEEVLTKMFEAKELLLEMPGAERTKSEDYYYGASAELQLTLYQSAYSIMFMNKFAVSPESLADLTLDDAITIIENLKDAALNAGKVSPETAEKIEEALAQIDSAEGADNKEKLEAFIKAKGNTDVQEPPASQVE